MARTLGESEDLSAQAEGKPRQQRGCAAGAMPGFGYCEWSHLRIHLVLRAVDHRDLLSKDLTVPPPEAA